jgi:hypothetical protein
MLVVLFVSSILLGRGQCTAVACMRHGAEGDTLQP